MNSQAQNSDMIHRDAELYSETVVFKVEDTLFKVLKNAFLHPGSFFETLFRLPQPTGSPNGTNHGHQNKDAHLLEGSSDGNPIMLERISKTSFRNFLRVLYPLSYEQWLDVLDLATMWDFPQIRSLAIGHLDRLFSRRPVEEQILVSKKYEVKAWLRRVYQLVIRRKDPVSVVDMMKAGLDLETLATLVDIRCGIDT
ncbi:hypothetical protein BJ165DRAFT_1403371 [Panaeolus papilionaceus]|nr:hypothetical protein BJ165DRAFT_1403371 [Panaeolus papilionaceus]